MRSPPIALASTSPPSKANAIRQRSWPDTDVRLRARLAAAWCLLAGGCAPRPFVLPSGTPSPAPDAAAVWSEATARCATLTSYSAELHLSGRVGSGKLRATVIGAWTADGRIRL